MEKAKNIIEFADNFDPSQPLGKEDSDAYVPIYEDILAKLCDRIVYDKLPSRTLFVAGQSGTGKTTALNFLPDEEIEKKYVTIQLHSIFAHIWSSRIALVRSLAYSLT